MLRKTLVVLLLIVVATALSLAQVMRGPMAQRFGERHEALIKELKLTEAQETQMQKLRIELMKKQTQLRSRVQTLRLDSKELFLADKIDRKAIESNVKAVTDAQEQMKLNFIDHWFAVNQILTPDQQKIWKKHAMAMGERMRVGMRQGMQERIRMRMGQRSDGFGDGDN
jgi:Spy/CpxP family protein refolding chaperone